MLINNAGITRDAQFVKWKDGAVAATMTEEAFDSVISVNLKGTFLCSRAVVPHMIRQGSGVILNTSSVVGLSGNFGQTITLPTKAGVALAEAGGARTGKIPDDSRGEHHRSRLHRH